MARLLLEAAFVSRETCTPRPWRGTLATLVVAVATGCAAPVAEGDEAEREVGTIAQAITGGERDSGDPSVVALLREGSIYCTGFVVARFVVATAAHCVSPTPPDAILFGASPDARGAKTIEVASSAVHPDYDEDALENDVAAVGLAERSPVAPLRIRTAPLDESFVGHPLRLVGFGASSALGASAHKRSGTTSILEIGASALRFKPMPAQTCVGDSGGPAFASFGAEGEAVVGIASSGDPDCKKYGRHVRIDRYVAFLDDFAESYSPPPPPTSVRSTGCSLARERSRSDASGAFFASLPSALAAAIMLRRRRR